MELALRELRDRLYPGRRISTTQVLEQVLRAVDALDSMDARIPWHDPTTGRGGLRRIVSVQDLPRSAAHLGSALRPAAIGCEGPEECHATRPSRQTLSVGVCLAGE